MFSALLCPDGIVYRRNEYELPVYRKNPCVKRFVTGQASQQKMLSTVNMPGTSYGVGLGQAGSAFFFGLGVRVWVSGVRVQGAGFKVEGAELRVEG